MNVELRSNRVKELVLASLEYSDKERTVFVRTSCATDELLQHEVESLLKFYVDNDDRLESPILGLSVGSLALKALHDPEEEFSGEVGRYRIVCEIGRGGMGVVYEAVRIDGEYEQRVAIKLIANDSQRAFTSRLRLRQERQILADLNHPNIARLLDGGTIGDDLPYLVMELVVGLPVDRYCDDRNLSTRDRLILFRQICSAVEYAHSRSVIHRDIKPSNILIDEGGSPKLLDFGIAKSHGDTANPASTATAFLVMTPEYASPEQMRGDDIGIASDIYSLGVVLYQLIAGKRPFDLDKRSPLQIVHTICEEEPLPPSSFIQAIDDPSFRDLADDLDKIALKAVRKEPSRRYASVRDFSDDIRRLLDGRPVMARDETTVYRGVKFFRRNRTAILSTVAASAVFLIAGLLFGILNERSSENTPRSMSFDESRVAEKRRGGTESPEARDLYLKGQALWNQRTITAIRLSVESFQQATEKDPDFALAFSGLANSYFLLGVWGGISTRYALPRAREASLRAIDLAPSAAEGHLSLAMVHWLYEYDWPAADLEFKKALELDPRYARAPHWYGLFLAEMGRFDDAVGAARRALELEPTSIPVNSDYARVLYYARRYDESLEQYQKVFAMNPSYEALYYELLELYETMGMLDEMLALIEKWFPSGSREMRKAVQDGGMRAYWHTKLGWYKDAFKKGSSDFYHQAEIYAQLGQADKAFELLDKAFESREHNLAQIKVNPKLDVLRDDPRFAAWLKRLRLD